MHADRGCQYTSAQLARVRPRAQPGPLSSPHSRAGTTLKPSFWATMKVEFYDRYLWPTKAAAKLAVGDWIERVYNRRHSAIGMNDIGMNDQPGRLRRPTHSDGTSRLTLCLPNGVKPKVEIHARKGRSRWQRAGNAAAQEGCGLAAPNAAAVDNSLSKYK